MMAAIHDVASAILDRTGEIDTFKLQKLTYYCQAWHLVWDDEPMFEDRIEAWANGPVVTSLYSRHRGHYRVGAEFFDGSAEALTEDQVATVDAVVDFYAHLSGQQLADLTHSEDPWKRARARANLALGERGNEEILLADMVEYYLSLEERGA